MICQTVFLDKLNHYSFDVVCSEAHERVVNPFDRISFIPLIVKRDIEDAQALFIIVEDTFSGLDRDFVTQGLVDW